MIPVSSCVALTIFHPLGIRSEITPTEESGLRFRPRMSLTWKEIFYAGACFVDVRGPLGIRPRISKVEYEISRV